MKDPQRRNAHGSGQGRSRWSLRAVQLGLRAVGLVAPRLAGALALQLMIRPRRRCVDLAQRQPFLDTKQLRYKDGHLRAYTWRGERRILLVHGWDASSGDFSSLIPRLQRAGWGGLAYDAPAHGRSDGSATDFLDLGAAFRHILLDHGPFDAVLAHSFGAAVALYGVSQDQHASPNRLVLGGAPTSLDQIFQIYADRLNLNSSVRRALNERIANRLGQPAAAFSMAEAIRHIGARVLLVHDREDPLLPLVSAAELQEAAPRARLVETRGLGHRGWLRSEEIFARILGFLERDGQGTVSAAKLSRSAWGRPGNQPR